jgi:hypothetical protein
LLRGWACSRFFYLHVLTVLDVRWQSALSGTGGLVIFIIGYALLGNGSTAGCAKLAVCRNYRIAPRAHNIDLYPTVRAEIAFT